MSAGRGLHAAALLPDGRVLISGGNGNDPVPFPLGTEIFDPATARWSPGPTLGRAFFAATVTMLSNGKVLVFGGQDAGGFPQPAAALFE